MYTIAQKQEHIRNLKAGDHFDKDLSLFMCFYPRHALNRELVRVNTFNISRLHGLLLNYLLDKVSAEDIEANRSPKDTTVIPEDNNPPKVADNDNPEGASTEENPAGTNGIMETQIPPGSTTQKKSKKGKSSQT